MKKIFKVVGGILGAGAIFGGLYINSQQDALLEKAVTMIEQKASDYLGTQIKIGGIEAKNINLFDLQKSEIIIRDIELFDKNSEHIAQVDEAKVKLKILSLYDEAEGAVDEINVKGAKVSIKKRTDETWNFDDVKIESTGESKFGALITVDESSVEADFDGKNISVEEISAQADCADMNAIDTNLTAKTFGSHISAKGFVGAENQTVHATVDSIDAKKILPYIPEGTLPESLEILGGNISNLKLHINRSGEKVNFLGSAEVEGGAVKVEDTEIENITGSATFSNSEVTFNASAVANNQAANASGVIHLDTDEVFFDINADSESFAPSAIIPGIGIDGAAQVTAHLTGTAKNPTVDAEIFTDYIAYENLSARNLKTHLNYGNEVLILKNLSAETFGGSVEGDAEIKTSDLSYNAHVKAYGLSVGELKNFADINAQTYGNLSGDLIVNGIGKDMDKLKVVGSAQADNVNYNGFFVNKAVASFYLNGKNLKIDNLKAELPSRGAVGVEGTFTDGALDFDFYGAHIDLAFAKNFNSQLDMSGLSDFNGKIGGTLDAPQIDLKLSAVDNSQRGGEHFKGTFFKQPFDSLKISAAGNFDGVNVEQFEIERGGKITWTVKRGTVGFTGAKKIDVELLTSEARVEDIVALIAPDEPLTGNINNTVQITGTLDNPQIAGNVDFTFGSYFGFLISSIHGKYFVDDEKIRLQDVEVISPMADATLNGTVDRKTKALDFVVQGQDLSLKRIQNKFPYPVEGHGIFEGLLTGTTDNPIFNGTLNAPELIFNGVKMTDVHGHVGVNGDNIVVDDFAFNQGDGSYKLFLAGNTKTLSLDGDIEVENVDIPELFLLAGQEAKYLNGKLNSKIDVGGSAKNPLIKLNGNISDGSLVGYNLNNVEVELNFLNQILYINKFEGNQGAEGKFNLLGSGGLSAPLNLTLTAQNLDLGIFSALAGLDMEVTGKATVDAKISGNAFNPEAEINLLASGSAGGATFDSLTSQIHFKDWICDLKDLTIQRMIGTQTVSASAKGKLPIVAFYDDPGEVKPDEQIDLNISLDGADLSLLPSLSKYVSWAIGETGGNLHVTGTAKNPKIDGGFTVNDGIIKFKGVNSPIESIYVSMMFKGTRFDIEKFTGNVGEGTINLTGGLSFANLILSDYNFNLLANELDVKSAVFTGPINAEFNVSEGKTPRGRVLPKVAGHVDLDKCTIGIPTIPDSDEPLPEFLMDISVNLGKRVHLYSSRLLDMFLTGSANFQGTSQFPIPSGVISVRRGGTVTYLQNVFDVKEGTAHFDRPGEFFPTVKFFAETRLTTTRIYLSIDGSLKDHPIKLTSSPEMSETEIMQLLTFRSDYDEGKGNATLADALSIGLQLSVVGEIEDTIKRTLGLDRFILTSGSGSAFERRSRSGEDRNENEFNISIGKYINDKVMLRYTQGINGDRITRFGVQYDINDNMGVTVEHENGEFIFGFEARYSF